MTSCFIHLFPGWLCLTLRWWPIDTLRGGDGTSEPECTSGINLADVLVSLCLYLVWQVLYYIKTEFHEKVRDVRDWGMIPTMISLEITAKSSWRMESKSVVVVFWSSDGRPPLLIGPCHAAFFSPVVHSRGSTPTPTFKPV